MKVVLWSPYHSSTLEQVADVLARYGLELSICIGSPSMCRDAVANAWSYGNIVVCVSAAPLCIRLITPLLRDKHSDPAVVVVTPRCSHIVPLLGDHRGGDMICEFLEKKLGARCIKTSRIDEEGMLSVDDLAYRLRMELIKGSLDDIVKRIGRGISVTTYLDERVRRIVDKLDHSGSKKLLERLSIVDSPRDAELCIVSDPELCRACGDVCLVLKRIALGLGMCSSCSPMEALRAVEEVLKLFPMPIERIDIVAVPEIRRDHPVVRYLKTMGMNVVSIPMDLAISFGVPQHGSRYGVRSLCEAVARAALGGGETIIVKARMGRATISIVERGFYG